MNTKYLVPLCATVALLAACSQHKDTAPPSDTTMPPPADTTPPPATTTTPGTTPDTPPPPPNKRKPFPGRIGRGAGDR